MLNFLCVRCFKHDLPMGQIMPNYIQIAHQIYAVSFSHCFQQPEKTPVVPRSPRSVNFAPGDLLVWRGLPKTGPCWVKHGQVGPKNWASQKLCFWYDGSNVGWLEDANNLSSTTKTRLHAGNSIDSLHATRCFGFTPN